MLDEMPTRALGEMRTTTSLHGKCGKSPRTRLISHQGK